MKGKKGRGSRVNQIQANLWGGWTLAQPVTQRERELEPGEQSSTRMLESPPKEGAEQGERQEHRPPHFLSSLSVRGRPSECFPCVSVCNARIETLLVGAGNSAVTQPCFPGLSMTPPSQETCAPLRRHSGTALAVQWLRCLAPNAEAEKRWSIFEELPHVQQDGRRGKITFRIKPHTCQRCSEGSNKPWVHQNPETPQRLRQSCV